MDVSGGEASATASEKAGGGGGSTAADGGGGTPSEPKKDSAPAEDSPSWTAIAAELSELRMRCASLEAERAQRDVAMARLESRLGSKEDEVQQLREELHSIRSSPGGADGPDQGDSAC